MIPPLHARSRDQPRLVQQSCIRRGRLRCGAATVQRTDDEHQGHRPWSAWPKSIVSIAGHRRRALCATHAAAPRPCPSTSTANASPPHRHDVAPVSLSTPAPPNSRVPAAVVDGHEPLPRQAVTASACATKAVENVRLFFEESARPKSAPTRVGPPRPAQALESPRETGRAESLPARPRVAFGGPGQALNLGVRIRARGRARGGSCEGVLPARAGTRAPSLPGALSALTRTVSPIAGFRPARGAAHRHREGRKAAQDGGW